MTQYWESSVRLSFQGYENIAAFVTQQQWREDESKSEPRLVHYTHNTVFSHRRGISY